MSKYDPGQPFDLAITWAGQLMLHHGTMALADLQAAWTGEEGMLHRATLKADDGAGPTLLLLATHQVRTRVAALKEAA